MSKRAETGPMQFGDDWRGLFIRGDNAGAIAQYLKVVLDHYEELIKKSGTDGFLLYSGILRNFGKTLQSSNQFVDTDVQMMKSIEECLKDDPALEAIKAGIEDVKAGRVRTLDPSELEEGEE